MEEKRYTTKSIDDATDQKMKWRLGYRNKKGFYEFEGDSLWTIARLMFMIQRKLKKEQLLRRLRPKGKAS